MATMASALPSKIDVHAHFLPDFYRQALQDAGHVPGPDGMPAIPVGFVSPHARI